MLASAATIDYTLGLNKAGTCDRSTRFSRRSPTPCGSIPSNSAISLSCSTDQRYSGAERIDDTLRRMSDRLTGQPAFVLGRR